VVSERESVVADDTSAGNESAVAGRRWPFPRRGEDRPSTVQAMQAGPAVQAVQDPNDIASEAEPHEVAPAPTASESSSLLVLAPARLAALGVALVLVVALAFVILFHTGPPSIADLRARAGVDSWSELAVGVKDDQPGVAYLDTKTGIWSGFDIDIAHMIGEDLGFRPDEVKFYSIESEDRLRMQATTPDGKNTRVPVKMVVASYSITAGREQEGARFSAPYLSTEQSVVTLADHSQVSTIGDLKGKEVCSLSTSTSQASLTGTIVILKNKVSDCFKELRAHRVDAVSTDAAILAGFEAADPHGLRHWDIGNELPENWGVNVGDNEALGELVDVTLYRSLTDPKDHRWEDAYQLNLQVEVSGQRGTPIAVGEQPAVPKPRVRQLPWDETYP
jgi:glutamate transport system substrate-binding protein